MSDQHFNPNDKVRIKREYDHRLVGGGTIAGEKTTGIAFSNELDRQYLVHSVFGGYSPNERPEIIEDWYPAKALELVEAAADQPEPRHLHEYDADAEAALLVENRRLAERVEQLEAALIAVVNDIRSTDWYHVDNEVIALVKATGIKHRHEREDGHG